MVMRLIDHDELVKLLECEKELAGLEGAGVDNWSGYDERHEGMDDWTDPSEAAEGYPEGQPV